MSERLQSLLTRLATFERGAIDEQNEEGNTSARIDLRARVAVSFIYLIIILSVPIEQLSELLIFAAFPIITAAQIALGYGRIAQQSLIALPFVALIGVFNIFYNRQPVFTIGSVVITIGWIQFCSIIVRALLSVQVLILLVRAEGYNALCRALRRIGVPSVFTTQLLMLYRYTFVLLEQMLSLVRARQVRSFGRRALPVSDWGAVVGELTVRTFDRSERIWQAMCARGFQGRMPDRQPTMPRWHKRDTAYLITWSIGLLVVRFTHPVERFVMLFNQL